MTVRCCSSAGPARGCPLAESTLMPMSRNFARNLPRSSAGSAIEAPSKSMKPTFPPCKQHLGRPEVVMGGNALLGRELDRQFLQARQQRLGSGFQWRDAEGQSTDHLAKFRQLSVEGRRLPVSSSRTVCRAASAWPVLGQLLTQPVELAVTPVGDGRSSQFLERAIFRDGSLEEDAPLRLVPQRLGEGNDALPGQRRLPQGCHGRPSGLSLVALMGLDDDRIGAGSVSVGAVVVHVDDNGATAARFVPNDVRSAGGDGGIAVAGLDDDLLE